MNHVDIRVAPHEPWYKYGVAVLLFEMAVAIAVSGYSLYMTFKRPRWLSRKALAPDGLRIQAPALHRAQRVLLGRTLREQLRSLLGHLEQGSYRHRLLVS